MKAVALKFREKKFRTFYRICILPLHIPHRKGEAKKMIEDELAMHLQAVKDNGLQAELETYQTARDLRQSTYDAMEVAKSEVGKNPSEKAGLKAAETLAAFEAAKGAYNGAYQ